MKIMKTLFAAMMCGGLLIATVAADDATTKTRTGKLDSKLTGTGIRASKLIGLNIENSQEKNVGEINDIVLNSKTGKIEYVAVTYGGFLGVGNKMFAVPFEAIQCKPDPDDRDDHVLVMNVTQKQLEGAKGFDEDNWPNFADRNFTDELYRRYNVKRRDREVNVDVSRRGVDVDVK